MFISYSMCMVCTLNKRRSKISIVYCMDIGHYRMRAICINKLKCQMLYSLVYSLSLYLCCSWNYSSKKWIFPFFNSPLYDHLLLSLRFVEHSTKNRIPVDFNLVDFPFLCATFLLFHHPFAWKLWVIRLQYRKMFVFWNGGNNNRTKHKTTTTIMNNKNIQQ